MGEAKYIVPYVEEIYYLCHNSKDMIIYHKDKNMRYWKSNLLRECSNREQLDQLPLLLDVKDLLTQVRILDKDRHYQRVARGILKQCKYNDIYLQNDAEKAEEIIKNRT